MDPTSIISGAFSGLVSAGAAKVPIQMLSDWLYGCFGWKMKAFAAMGNLRYQKAVLDFVKKVGLRIELINPNDIKEPTFRIANSYLEASSNCLTEEELSSLFANLVASTIDKSKEKYLHPAFGEILSQMSSLDARILRELLGASEYGLRFSKAGSIADYFLPGCYQWFDASWEELDQSLRNLNRLGLISIADPAVLIPSNPREETKLLSDPRIQENLDRVLNEIPFAYTKPDAHPIQITTFGYSFLKVCS